MYFRPFAVFICLYSFLNSSFVALDQIDLKRFVAYSSIAHMSFATLCIFTFTEAGVKGAIYMMISHGLTSSLLFFLVGVLSDRYHTRDVLAFTGLFQTMPLFSFFFIFASLASIGLPGTSGFLPEFLGFYSIVSTMPLVMVPLMIAVFTITAATLIIVLRILYGHSTTTRISTYTDLTKL